MKKVLVALLLVVGISTFAQEAKKSARRAEIDKMTPEQRNQLHLKKLTLDLELNENQQKEMSKVITEESAKRQKAFDERKANREKGVKPTADEIFAKQNKNLDDEIALKARVKKILTPEQFNKWETSKKERKEKMRENGRKRGKEMPKAKE